MVCLEPSGLCGRMAGRTCMAVGHVSLAPLIWLHHHPCVQICSLASTNTIGPNTTCNQRGSTSSLILIVNLCVRLNHEPPGPILQLQDRMYGRCWSCSARHAALASLARSTDGCHVFKNTWTTKQNMSLRHLWDFRETVADVADLLRGGIALSNTACIRLLPSTQISFCVDVLCICLIEP